MSDDDLIRRGDALKIAKDMNNGETAKAIHHAIAAIPAVTAPDVAGLVAEAYENGMRRALGLVASLGYGKNEDVDRGHQEAFGAIQQDLDEWKAALAPAQPAPQGVDALVKKIADWEARIDDCEWASNSSCTSGVREEMREAIATLAAAKSEPDQKGGDALEDRNPGGPDPDNGPRLTAGAQEPTDE